MLDVNFKYFNILKIFNYFCVTLRIFLKLCIFELQFIFSKTLSIDQKQICQSTFSAMNSDQYDLDPVL